MGTPSTLVARKQTDVLQGPWQALWAARPRKGNNSYRHTAAGPLDVRYGQRNCSGTRCRSIEFSPAIARQPTPSVLWASGWSIPSQQLAGVSL